MVGQLLVVEDDPIIIQVARDLLGFDGHTIITAADGIEGLELFSAGAFDLVLTDVKMPRMDGIELMRLIKAKDPSVEVIVFTGYGTMELAIEVMRNGGYDFLLKPDDMTRRLRSVVVRALEKRQLNLRNQELLGSLQEQIIEKTNETRRLTVQQQITSLLTGYNSINDAAPALLDSILQNIGWQYGALWSVERFSDQLTCKDMIARTGKVNEPFIVNRRTETFIKRHGLPGQVWAQRRFLMCTEGAEPRAVYEAPVFGKLQGLAFPILHGEKIFGVIEFFHSEMPYPDENMIRLMTSIGNQIGLFMEREQLELQFHQSQKLEAIGRLAGGIAHDFNNLLTAIMGYAHLIERQVAKFEPLHRNAQQIQKTGHRAASLIQQLLTLSRNQVLKPELTDLNQVIADLSPVMDRLLTEQIELRTAVMTSPELILADRTQIEQVILNLIVNARDAMSNGGMLTVKTMILRLEEQEALLHGLNAGKYVCLTVVDTGHGMDETVMAHLFEPFFTTKEKGKGSGLGLATVYSIVTQSGGVVEVTSETGKGTTFSLYFPVALTTSRKQIPQDPETRRKAEEAHGTESVLIVENEEDIREIMTQILEGLGYTVMVAANGLEGLALIKTYNKTLDLVITDLVLPGMTGTALIEQILRDYPNLKIMIISGSLDESSKSLHLSDFPFLPKPFTPEDLLLQTRTVLDTPQITFHEPQ